MERDFIIGDLVVFVAAPKRYNFLTKNYEKGKNFKKNKKYVVDGFNRYGVHLKELNNFYKRECIKRIKNVG